jgi:hypothetical protein
MDIADHQGFLPDRAAFRDVIYGSVIPGDETYV